MLREFFRHRSVHVFLSGMNGSNRAEQSLAHHSLYHVPARSRSEGTFDISVTFKGSKDDDTRVRRLRKELSGQFVAAHIRQAQIDEGDVGLHLPKKLQRLGARSGRSDHLHVRLQRENARPPFTYNWVIV